MKCSKCGKTKKELKYSKDYQQIMDLKDWCFDCAFWCKRAKVDLHRSVIVESENGREAFFIGNENADERAFRGHGGRQFNIKFHDGREVTTTNLWHNGIIPEVWYAHLPVNAVFNSGS